MRLYAYLNKRSGNVLQWSIKTRKYTTLWVWSVPFHTWKHTGKRGNYRWRMRQWRRHVYLHRAQLHRKNHPDRPSRWEKQTRRERKQGVHRSGGEKLKQTKNGVMRHHVGIAPYNNKDEWQLGGREVRKWCQIDCERENTERWVSVIKHRATCNTKKPPLCIHVHHLFTVFTVSHQYLKRNNLIWS